MDLYQRNEKDEKGKGINKCPECGKITPKPYIGEVAFCSRMCEMNYRYRMRNKDLKTGRVVLTPDRVKKI